jgi:hypothetical protein
MVGDSSVSSRVAIRDQRVAIARARLREADTESARADAVYAEFEAKLAFDRACWDHAVGPTPAVAARVAIGRLSLDEAVLIEQANGDPTASVLVNELVGLLSARDWLALEALVSVDPWKRFARCERAVREGDREGARLLLGAEPLYSKLVELVARAFGREAVASVRARALAAIAECERDFAADPLSSIEPIARLSYALGVDEQRALILDLAARVDGVELSVGAVFGRGSACLSVIAVALLALGEHGRAQRWIQRALFGGLDSATEAFGPAHLPLFEALRAHGTGEEHVRWLQRYREWLDVPANTLRLVDQYEVARGDWRSEIERAERRKFDADEPYWGPLHLLTDEQFRVWLQRQWARPTTREASKRFVDRLRRDPAFEAELLRWRPRAPLRARLSFDDDGHLGMLLDAARDNNPAALDAVCTWSSPDEVLGAHRFSEGLPLAAVEAILDRAPRRAEPDRDILDAAGRVLVHASDEAVERWKRERGVSVTRESDNGGAARALALEHARRWLRAGDDVELTPAVIEAARTLDGGLARSTQTAQRMVAAAQADGWPEDGPLDGLELSLVDHYDLETLAMLVDRPWRPRQSAVAYRVVLRCAALQAALPQEESTLRVVRAQVAEAFREWRFDDWEAAMLAVFGGGPPVSLEDALRAWPWALSYASTNFARDCVQLGIVDDLLDLLAQQPADEWSPERICELLPWASEAAVKAAVAALREAFRSNEIVYVRDELLPWLTVEDIVARWDALVSTSMSSMLYGPLLAKVGGVGLVDRVGDRLVELPARGSSA